MLKESGVSGPDGTRITTFVISIRSDYGDKQPPGPRRAIGRLFLLPFLRLSSPDSVVDGRSFSVEISFSGKAMVNAA